MSLRSPVLMLAIAGLAIAIILYDLPFALWSLALIIVVVAGTRTP